MPASFSSRHATPDDPADIAQERLDALGSLGMDFMASKASIDESALDTADMELATLSCRSGERRRSHIEHDLGVPVYLERPQRSKDSVASAIPDLPSYLDGRPRRRSSFQNAARQVAVIVDTASTKGHESIPLDTYDSNTPSTLPASVAQSQSFVGTAQGSHLRARLHFASLCFALFVEGWNDGTTGPLLPRIQDYYRVGFAVVSLLFVLNCIGFVSGAFMNVWLNDRYGLGKVIVFGAVCQAITYAIQSAAGPFPLMVIANGLGGFGIALQNAQANGFVGSFKEKAPMFLGFLHGSYGAGAFAAPLVATQFAHMRHWSFHYLISLSLAILNTISLIVILKFKTQDQIFEEEGREPGEVGLSEKSKYSQILGIKAVHFLAFFALVYVGVEVTLGGWIVTFIIRKRDGGPSAGYISSGFFGGLTLGRLGLMWLNRMVGERRILFVYATLALALEVTIWAVPSLLENAIAVSVIGLLLGPMYPILVNHTTLILPRWLITGSVGWIAGIGQAGSALLPFITGLLASRYGIGSLQPFLIAMIGTMICVWAIVPKGQRRID